MPGATRCYSTSAVTCSAECGFVAIHAHSVAEVAPTFLAADFARVFLRHSLPGEERCELVYLLHQNRPSTALSTGCGSTRVRLWLMQG
jgi:hypothetical protein